VPYLPPHPFRGMKYHRYPIFVFEQPSNEWLASRTQVFENHRDQVIQRLREGPTTNTSDTPIISPLLSIPTTTETSLRTYCTRSPPRKTKYVWNEGDEYDRDDFNIRAWANQLGMKPVGAHLVRCEWDDNVLELLKKLDIEERAFKKIRSEETSHLDFQI